MRKVLRVFLVILILLFVGIQVVGLIKTNPPVDPTREFGAKHTTTRAVSSILQRSCNDCHSNRTAWPWYSHIAPASWVVVHDVKSGRKALNLSEWGNYDIEKRQRLTGKICEEVKGGEMPTSKYVLLHPHARLTVSDIQVLCSWSQRIPSETEENGKEGD